VQLTLEQAIRDEPSFDVQVESLCGSGRWRRRRYLLLYRGSIWMDECVYPALKRLLDVVCAGAGLVILSPLLLLTAAAIKLTDFGPVFYRQERVGQFGKRFPFFKLRSMVRSADGLRTQLAHKNHHGNSITFKMKNDPRITPVGRWIRRLSIDELPQLWCVLNGDMTLVGPRPPLPAEVEQYHVADRRRLEVTPGLTCIWQVSGRGDVPFPKQVRMDVDYIERRTLWFDLKLLLRTIPAVLGRKGAY
jgi:lipopolysaccharide/colanic/teichoic acid biosynthesis glycosyltransferase